VADPAIDLGGWRVAPLPNLGRPLDENFKLYMNQGHRYPVNAFFFIKMHNSLFRLFNFV